MEIGKEDTRILLLTTPVTASARDFIRSKLFHPPLGIVYVYSSLKKEGFKVRVIDSKARNLTIKKAVEIIKKFSPRIVGVYSHTSEISVTNDLGKAIKEVLPGVNFIVGGCHTTQLPEETLLRCGYIDITVVGEAEQTMVELANAIRNKASIKDIKGICYRSKEGIIKTAQRELEKNLDSLPFPEYGQFEFKDYAKVEYSGKKSLGIISGRGCPHQCIFCQRVNGSLPRFRSVENVINEIRQDIRLYGIRHYVFYDETFTINRGRCISLCNELKKLNIVWACTTRVNLVDEELLGIMSESGCKCVGFGVESGNDEMLKKLKKGITKEQVVKAVKAAKKHGLFVEASFILGAPFETEKTAQDTANFALLLGKLGANHINFGIMMPLPGTEVEQMALKGEGGYKLISGDWEDYGTKYVGSSISFRHVSTGFLENLQFVTFVRFYSMNLEKFFSLIKDVEITTVPFYVLTLLLNKAKRIVNGFFALLRIQG